LAKSSESRTPRQPRTKLVPEQMPSEPRNPLLLLAVAAGLCWACVLALLFSGELSPTAPFWEAPRIIFYILVLAAAFLTFVPIQRMLQVPRLAVEGVLGTTLLLYCLAFVPAPNAWLLSPPETPVYLIFGAALFWSVSSAALAPIFALGKRFFHQRARKYDLRRARRQAHEVGGLIVAWATLASLRLFTPLTAILVVLIFIVIELLFLSFVEAEV
jgi:hypothetical protein